MLNHYLDITTEEIDGEIWKSIPGLFDTHYVSNLGRVKSMKRMSYVEKYGTYRKTNGRILKQRFNPDGYLHVFISMSNEHKKFSQSCGVHRFVALAFIENENNKPQVNHINGVKHDNSIANLEWATLPEQAVHSRRILGNFCGAKNVNSILTEDEVKYIKKSTLSNVALGKIFGVTDGNISNIKLGIGWKHLNHLISNNKRELPLTAKIINRLLRGGSISARTNITKDDVKILSHQIVPRYELILTKERIPFNTSKRTFYYTKYKIDFLNPKNNVPIQTLKKYLKKEKEKLNIFIKDKEQYSSFKINQ